MAKIVQINDITIKFDQRAQGEETRYWQGQIRKGKTVIGHFSNRGHGGPTDIYPPATEKLLADVLIAADTYNVANVTIEPAAYIIDYADMLAYDLKCTANDFTLTDYILAFLTNNYGMPIPAIIASARIQAKNAIAVATLKADKLTHMPKALRAAKNGQTMVRIGDEFFIYKTRSKEAIEKSICRNGNVAFEILA